MSATTAYRILAVVVLAGVATHHYATVRRADAVHDYHRRVRDAVAKVPARIGGWVGTDVPVAVQAVQVLDPNVLLSRRYLNVDNGQTAGVLFVHCADAHDMAGHFPLRCYPAQGWDVKRADPRDWVVGDLRVTGYEYEFTADRLDGAKVNGPLVVVNCLLRPGGRVLRDMPEMTRTIVGAGAGGQASGAAQLQVYFEANVPQARRDEAVAALVEGYRPLIDAVLAEVK